MKRILFCLSLAMFLAAISGTAHHSFSAMFDGKKPIELEGTVTKLEWANPHIYFYLDVTGADGKVVNWACETAGPNGLIRQGWSRTSLKVGDRVTVWGYPARNGKPLADARQVRLPDGRTVFSGTPNDGGPKAPEAKESK